MRFSIFPFVAVLSLFCWTSQAQSSKTCGQSIGKLWKYCLFTSTQSTKADDFVYYFHRAGSDETSWESFAYYLNKVWGAARTPTVIAVSYGEAWLLTEPNSSPQSGLLKHFVEQVIPEIEQHIIGRAPKQRMLVGLSMGGFNATGLILHYPNLFSRAALLCPGYIDFNPYDGDAAIQDYIKRTNADKGSVNDLVQFIQSYYPDAKSWNSESPLLVAKKYLTKSSPSLFIVDGVDDYFGFYPGAKKFSELAKDQGVQAEFNDDMTLGHCEMVNMTKLGRFLEP